MPKLCFLMDCIDDVLVKILPEGINDNGNQVSQIGKVLIDQDNELYIIR